MVFNSLAFAIFLPIVLLAYYAIGYYSRRAVRWQNGLLLVASLVFYGWWNWRFLGLLAGTILIDFYASHAVFRAESHAIKKRWLLVSIVSNLTVLGIFKYSDFFIQSFAELLTQFGFHVHPPLLRLILPVGISFYTFMSMAYVIDVYRGELEPTKSLFDFALFVSYFPHLVAGPILRAPQLLPQLTRERLPEKRQIVDGISLILIGLVRKVVIADILADQVVQMFGQPEAFTSLDLVFGMWLFALQLYGDFAGYSDMARGMSKLFGIELNLNFNTPYLSQNITEFWRRWHISLSSWLRDYVYIPLGGNRKGKLRTYLNNFLTMVIGGLWHGANWTYVVWGALNGIYLAVHKAYLSMFPARVNSKQTKWKTAIKIIFTFQLASFAFLIFRSPTFDIAYRYVSRIVSVVPGFHTATNFFFLPFILLLISIDLAQYTGRGERLLGNMHFARRAVAFGVVFAIVLIAGAENSVPFIYFQF